MKFTPLAEYAPTLVADSRTRMSKFVSSESIVKYCTSMLIEEINITHLMIHPNKLKSKLTNKGQKSPRGQVADCDFSHTRFGGHGHSIFS